MDRQIGIVAAGSYADLLVLDTSPLNDIAVLASPETHLKLIMANGSIVTSTLN